MFGAVLLGTLLGLALFISPYRLHQSSGSVFLTRLPTSTEHSSHEGHHHDTKELRCLRCVLYGFQLPETIEPLIFILVVLGFLKLVKLTEPLSFVPFGKSARAPPVSL
jgi:hypothetical protein